MSCEEDDKQFAWWRDDGTACWLCAVGRWFVVSDRRVLTPVLDRVLTEALVASVDLRQPVRLTGVPISAPPTPLAGLVHACTFGVRRAPLPISLTPPVLHPNVSVALSAVAIHLRLHGVGRQAPAAAPVPSALRDRLGGG